MSKVNKIFTRAGNTTEVIDLPCCEQNLYIPNNDDDLLKLVVSNSPVADGEELEYDIETSNGDSITLDVANNRANVLAGTYIFHFSANVSRTGAGKIVLTTNVDGVDKLPITTATLTGAEVVTANFGALFRFPNGGYFEIRNTSGADVTFGASNLSIVRLVEG